MPKLELALLVGAESKEWLASLTRQIDRLEKINSSATKALAKSEEAEETDDTEESEDDDDFKPAAKKAKAKAKKAASFDDDEDEETEEDDGEDEETEDAEESEVEEDEEEPAPKKKAAKGKSKKLTADDCNDAAKKLAGAIGGKPGRTAVMKIMKKQFDVESVQDLKPTQFMDFVAAMNEAIEEHEA